MARKKISWPAVWDEAAQRGSDNENHKAQAVEPAPAEKIAQPAHGDNQADQNQIVDQDCPLNGRELAVKGRRSKLAERL